MEWLHNIIDQKKSDFFGAVSRTFNTLRMVLRHINSVVLGEYCAISVVSSVFSIEQICGKYCAKSIQYPVDSTQQYPLNSQWIVE